LRTVGLIGGTADVEESLDDALRRSEESEELRFFGSEELLGLDVIERARPIVDRYLSAISGGEGNCLTSDLVAGMHTSGEQSFGPVRKDFGTRGRVGVFGKGTIPCKS
jgi:hypothetical protein